MSAETLARSAHATTEIEIGNGLPIEHLQLRATVNGALRSRGVKSVGDARSFLLEADIDGFPHAAELAEAICQLESWSIDGKIDWKTYWRARGFAFHYLCAALPGLDRLNEDARSCTVTRDMLGLGGRLLAAHGYRSLGSLVDALRAGIDRPPGIGLSKLQDFYERLGHLSDRVDAAGSIAEAATPENQEVVAGPADLPDAARVEPIDVLSIGVKTRLLRRAGYRTVGDLVSADPGSLTRIPSVGRRTIVLALERATLLGTAVRDGAVDWNAWSHLSGVPLIPKDPPANGSELLSSLPDLLMEVARQTADPIIRDLIALRILPAPHRRSPLEDIAARNPRPDGRRLSRQRVQQMESQILRQLTASLIRGRDEGIGIAFHPGFVAWWGRMAAEFSGTEEIAVDEFLQRLAQAWGVTVPELIPSIPVICAIVTGDTQLPAELRHTSKLPASLHELPEATGATPLRVLRLGRDLEQIEQKGCATLAGLVQLARTGGVPAHGLTHLQLVSDCLRDGEICWRSYREAMGLLHLPSSPPRSPTEFVEGLPKAVEDLLESVAPTLRSSQIFRLRTRVPEYRRPTLTEVGAALGTWGSSIKREETELLEALHDLLVDHRFAGLALWLDGFWLGYITEAARIFAACEGSFERFGAGLALHWKLAPGEIEEAQAILWAILTGYPPGRGRKGSARPEQALPSGEAIRIRLRGFRSVH